jgi:hypothetical protein
MAGFQHEKCSGKMCRVNFQAGKSREKCAASFSRPEIFRKNVPREFPGRKKARHIFPGSFRLGNGRENFS